MERKNERLPIFTERFRELQGARSNTEFAEFLGISRQTVGFYWNGDRAPDAVTLTKISEKCNVSSDWLLGLSQFRNKEKYESAESFSSAVLSLMAKEFDENDIGRVRCCIMEIIKGFKYALCEYTAGYTHYESAVITMSNVFSASASCIKIAVDSSEYLQNQDQDCIDELFKKLCHVLEKSSIEAYKTLGVYFYALRKSILEEMQANDVREHDFRFVSEADELLKENEKKYVNFLEQELMNFVNRNGRNE